MQERLAEVGADIDGAKDIAARAMIETGNRSENFALGSFAGTRCTEEKKSFVNHDQCN